MNGAKFLIKTLKKYGVEKIFGYPGGAIMPIYDALLDGKIEHILCRNEQGAIISAIGYARTSKKIGICFATSGPGVTNIITGLADALLDSVPLIVITGQVNTSLMGTDAFQEIDTIGLSLSCTKHSFLVDKLYLLPSVISESFYLSTTGRPGPVLIDIPKDIQLANFNKKSIFFSKKIKNLEKIKGNLKIAKKLIKKSMRPILYIGGGVVISGSISKLRFFLNKTRIPSVVTLKGIGSPNYHDTYYLGMLGMHGNKAANLAVQYCDLLIAIGARFDDRVTGKLNHFAPQAKIIHLDIDKTEFNKLRKAHVTISGNLDELLTALALIQPLSLYLWHKEITLLKVKCVLNHKLNKNKHIYAPELLTRINNYLPKDSVVTTDVGQHQMWTAQYIKFNKPENFITSGGLGTMGFGIPAAIGAKIYRPNNTVICITGDGSFMMNVQELATIKRKKLKIKLILLDNKHLGMVRQWQQLFFNKRYSETDLSDNPNFLMLAKSFKIMGMHIFYKHQINYALKIMFNYPGSFLLQVSIDKLSNVWPLVPPGSGNNIMIENIND